MKHGAIPIIVIFLPVLSLMSQAQQHEFPVLRGPYLGQKPPGKTTEPFGLGIVGLHQNLHREYNVYFGARIENVGDICISRYKNGQYLDPEKPGPEVNKAEEYDYSPFVSPDGRVLIFTRSQTPPRLFISYRKKDGTWTEAKDLAGIIEELRPKESAAALR